MESFLYGGARLLVIAACCFTTFSGFAITIVPYGAPWRYFVGTREASSPDVAAWRKLGFDDASWNRGPAPLGYSTSPNSAAEQALVTFLPTSLEGNYSSVFVRGEFVAKNPSAGNTFTVNVNIDDGCIVWINGTEVGRYNVPDGEAAYNQWALSAGEATLISFSFQNGSQGPVVAGTNVIAVQVFNGNLTSSDLVFDLALESDLDEEPPVLLSVAPPANGAVALLTDIDLVFSENVSGVDASDLLINGVNAESFRAISPREYVFSFPQPPDGMVTVRWAADHGIADLAGNAFAGGSWTYTVQPADRNADVIITEFLADNGHGLRDDDGGRSDWIELRNTSKGIADLSGWFLTDNPANLTKWRFPAITLDSGEYLVVFASGKNKTNNSAPLHTNFKIEKGGGYLALVDARTNVVSAFAPYPPQREDISYGRDANNPGLTGFVGTPTPGTANNVSGSGFSPEVSLSIPGGVYTSNSLSVRMIAPAGQIRYTLDGSVPTTSSQLYSGPVNVSSSLVLKARAFQTGLLPGPITAESYTLVDSSVANFNSNLPLLILSTSGREIGQDITPRTFASVIAIDTFRGRSSAIGKPEFIGRGGIEVRGQSSTGFPKKQYNFAFEDPYREQEGVGLFGLPADADWALYAPYTDKPFLQNFLAYELYEKMGHYSVRRRFVEVFLDTNGGKVSYGSDYAGIYILVEKIKIDKNRVDIDSLTPFNTSDPEISGGYMFKKDKDSPGDYAFNTVGNSSAGFSPQTLKLHQPKPAAATPAQKAWLRAYLIQMERALYASNWKTATGTNHWSYYIDALSFVDYQWMVEFAKQIDGYRLSNYFYKPRGGTIHMSPIWDWNLSFGNADYLDGESTSNWYWQELGENDHIWLRRLMCGTSNANGTSGDPDFNQMIVDRWSELRTNVLSSTNVIARAQELAQLLDEAAARDFQRWPRLGTYIWPNPSIYSQPTTYAGIMRSFTNWIKGRYNWIDSQFLPVPEFDLRGGLIAPGTALTLGGAGGGTIYYTVDGSDPRLPGGGVSPQAVRYSGGLTLQQNTKIVARRQGGGKWSGPAVTAFAVEKPTLEISEVMYHPAAPNGVSTFGDEDFEFVELRNSGRNPVALSGVSLSGGIQFSFASGTLDPGAYLILGKSAAALRARYGEGLEVAGEYSGFLSNAGDTIVLKGSAGEPISEFKFNDRWYPATDGGGFSLVRRSETATEERLGDAASWRPSAREGGSPGTADAEPASIGVVVVSELLARPFSGAAQAIELQNLSSRAADIGGWFLTDNHQKPRKYRFPTGTFIAPGGFLVVSGNQLADAGSALDPFSFAPAGEEVYLFSADQSGALTGYVHGFTFGAQAEGRSVGRYTDLDGHEHFGPQQSLTLGGTNSGPWQAPIVLSEVMYHPPDVLVNGAAWNDTEDEFLELANRSEVTVPLYDPARPTNTWRIRGGVSFDFAQGTSVPAEGVLVLVNFDPVADVAQAAAFRAKYSVPQQSVLLGPYKGNLANDKDRISLEAPDVPMMSTNTEIVPYTVEDELEYADSGAWNAAADGFGFSLSRVTLECVGNEPAQWAAAAATPGRVATPGAAPVFTLQPKSQFARVGATVTLKVDATGTGPLSYRWLFKGSPVAGATGPVLELLNAPLTNSGPYEVIVSSADRAMTSYPAYVMVSVDSDQDGMPDEWEFTYGLNPFDPQDALQDADGDGLTNADEFIAGTNPTSAQSYLALSPAETGALRFFAAGERSYTILVSDSLSQPVWRKLVDVSAASNGAEVAVPDPWSAAERFYRIVTPAQ